MDKDALFLSVNEFSTKVLIGDTIFPSPCGGRSGIYVFVRATRRSSLLEGKDSTFVSKLF